MIGMAIANPVVAGGAAEIAYKAGGAVLTVYRLMWEAGYHKGYQEAKNGEPRREVHS